MSGWLGLVAGGLEFRSLGAQTPPSPAGFAVTIGGVDYTDLYLLGSLQVEDLAGGRGSCSLSLSVEHAGQLAGELNVPALVGLELLVENALGRHFGGHVLTASVTVGHTLLEPWATVGIEAVGFGEYADRQKLSTVFDAEGQTAGDIASWLFTNYLAPEGLALGNIATGYPVARLSASYATPAELLDELVRLSGSSYSWRVDRYKRFFFEPRSATSAPTWDSGELQAAAISYTREGYRNVQVVEGGTGTSSTRTERFVCDGEPVQFEAALPIAELVEIRVGGVPVPTVDIGIKEVDLVEWVWQVGERGFGQNTSPDLLPAPVPPAPGLVLELDYRGHYPIATVRPDLAAIAERAAIEGGTGIYMDVATEEHLESVAEARELAGGLLARHRQFEEILRFELESPGWYAGQLVVVDLGELGVSGLYLIQTVTITDIGGVTQDTELRSSVEATRYAGVPEWLQWLRMFFRSRDPFTVRANQVIDTPIQFTGEVGVHGQLAVISGQWIDPFDADLSSVLLVGSRIPRKLLAEDLDDVVVGGSASVPTAGTNTGPVIGPWRTVP